MAAWSVASRAISETAVTWRGDEAASLLPPPVIRRSDLSPVDPAVSCEVQGSHLAGSRRWPHFADSCFLAQEPPGPSPQQCCRDVCTALCGLSGGPHSPGGHPGCQVSRGEVPLSPPHALEGGEESAGGGTASQRLAGIVPPEGQGLWSKARAAQARAAPKGGPSGRVRSRDLRRQAPQGLPWPLLDSFLGAWMSEPIAPRSWRVAFGPDSREDQQCPASPALCAEPHPRASGSRGASAWQVRERWDGSVVVLAH